MKRYFFLLVIFSLFLGSRLLKLSENPPSVYWDEASVGYNAYAIGIDGKDEWGSFLPVHFRAFGEFKLPVYIYSVVPFVKIFGLNAFSVRFPSVLYSLGIVLLTYLLARKVTRNEAASIFSAFYVVVTPWLFIFSRTGYEATAGLMLFLLGIYLYLKALENPKWFLVATLSFIGSIYSYNSFRILSCFTLLPFTVYLIWKYRERLKKIILVLTFSLVLFILSWVPIIRLYKYDMGGQRLLSVGLSGTTTQKIKGFATNYAYHYSPEFLFVNGDTNLRSQMPGFGQLYWVSLPFIIFGLLKIFKEKSFLHLSVFFLLLISPIPAALTKESPHALRSIASLPFYAITVGIGLEYLTLKIRKYSSVVLVLTSLLFLFCFESYLIKYFTEYPVISSKDWQFTYKQVFEEYKSSPVKNQKVIVSDEYGQPYIFALFYLKFIPDDFRQTVKYNPPDKWGFSLVSSFANFEFR